MIHRDIHRQARQIADSEVGAARRLHALPAEEALLVFAGAMRKVAAAVADCLLAEAQADPRLQVALESTYGTERAVRGTTVAGRPTFHLILR